MNSDSSYLPEYSPLDSMTIDNAGVVLSSDKAVLYKIVLKKVDSVPIGSPGKDLDPSHFSLLLRSVRSTEQNCVESSIDD